MNVLERFGIQQKKTNFAQTLFYFLRECHVNPLDEEYIVYHKNEKIRIVKKGIPIPLFIELMEEINEHYKREAEQYKKMRRR